jgi:hypothetical protein
MKYSRIIHIFFSLVFTLIFMSCDFYKEPKELKCTNMINSQIVFTNFDFTELKDIKIQYQDSQKRLKTMNLDFSPIHYDHKDKNILTENSFDLEKDVVYYIETMNDIFYLKIDSIGIHYQNTMFSESQVCGVIKYTINNKEYRLKDLVIDKNKK